MLDHAKFDATAVCQLHIKDVVFAARLEGKQHLLLLHALTSPE